MFLRFLDRLINHEWMDCPPSGYSFTQDDETKDIFFVGHSWWHTSAPMEKEKKRNERKEKRKSFPSGQPGRGAVGVSLDERSLLGVFSSASGVP